MQPQEIAQKLYEFCAENKFEQAQRQLYAENATSIEPAHSPGMQTVQGLDNIIAKGDMFQSMIETYHGGYVNEPQVFGNYISMQMGMDVTMKGGQRMNMEELAIYEVKDGKIISEQFLY
ncbi:MAG: nuclear transport factor 2 family protein [Chitinophagales bacterium]|nr:nuclear transport factor 2 family protein [Bacteroidota bacterium]MCB9043978.1 nuclear transport factor 2 family protein [Chitinophagales bacterium]